MIRALLFDFDGLLLDTESPSHAAWRELYDEFGHEFPQSEWLATIGTLSHFNPLAHLSDLGAIFDADELAERRRRRKHQLCDAEHLRPGIADYLAEAERRNLKTAIVTSGPRDWIDRHLTRLGLDSRFDTIVCADRDHERAKPSPTLYLEALETLGVSAEEAIALEDSPNGVRAAKAAGIFCVAVPNPITRELDLAEADLVVETLENLPLERLIALHELAA